MPHDVHAVVVVQRHAVGDARGHYDHHELSRDLDRQFLLEALVQVFDAIQKDEADQAHDQRGDVGAGNGTEDRLYAL